MNRFHFTSVLCTALLLLVGLTGCSEDSGSLNESQQVAVDDYDQIDLSKDNGGLTATDELEAFGDPDLLLEALADDESTVGDVWAESVEVRELERLADQYTDPNHPARPRFTFLRIKWGQLDAEPDTPDGSRLDWTGELSVDRGFVIVRRIVRFERPYDHVVRPRLDRHTVNWVSHTGPHYDGILIEIIEPPADPDDKARPEENYLHFRTGMLEQSYLVSELADLDEIVLVDDLGNGVHFNGFSLTDISLCPKGFLSARWAPTSNDEPDSNGNLVMGHYRGRWVGLHGHLKGFFRGAYGLNADGERVFVGKYISRAGLFRGFLRGTWEPDDGGLHWSEFHGHWVGAAEVIEGVLGGRAYNVPGREGGFLEGRWTAVCDDEAVAKIY